MDDVKELLRSLKGESRTDIFYEKLGPAGLLIKNYGDYLTTYPADPDAELKRTANAGFTLACALLTMLLREDYFIEGSFVQRAQDGTVDYVLDRMIVAYDEKRKK